MSDIITAPWTTEQVDALNRFQRSGMFHPFTCGAGHGGHVELFATVDGWVCPHCAYRQDWAHAFMAEEPQRMLGLGTPSPLRDLIRHIDRVAQHHIAYPQACNALGHLRDHLSALAFVEETNQRAAADSPAPVYRR